MMAPTFVNFDATRGVVELPTRHLESSQKLAHPLSRQLSRKSTRHIPSSRDQGIPLDWYNHLMVTWARSETSRHSLAQLPAPIRRGFSFPPRSTTSRRRVYLFNEL